MRVPAFPGAMTRVELACITMAGSEYVLYPRDGGPAFPHGVLSDGEHPGAGARRLVREWTGTEAPKLEMVDVLAAPGVLTFVMRALLVAEPQGAPQRFRRMELPERVGALSGKWVEDALKTSLAYKLTRL